MLPEPVIRYLAAHLQLVSRRQLLAMGYGRTVIHGWVRRGHLVRVERGVYTLPGIQLGLDQRVYAKVLRCGPGAMAGPRATLALLRVEGFTVCDDIDVVITEDRELSVPSCTTMTVTKHDRGKHRRVVPILSATRALIEVAPEVGHRRLRVAFDDARRRKLLTVEHMRRRATALLPHPGAVLLLELVDGGVFDPESEGERAMQAFLEETLPGEVIEWQVRDLVPGRRLDAAVRRVLVGFEFDSRDYHVDRAPDYLRDLESGIEHVHVVRVTSGMIRHQRQETQAGIRALVARREQLFPAATPAH